MDSSVWKTVCRFCGRLAEADECKECQDHFKKQGHHPNEVRCYQAPGQPRVMVRYCGECNKSGLGNPRSDLRKIVEGEATFVGDVV